MPLAPPVISTPVVGPTVRARLMRRRPVPAALLAPAALAALVRDAALGRGALAAGLDLGVVLGVVFGLALGLSRSTLASSGGSGLPGHDTEPGSSRVAPSRGSR